MKFKLNKTSVKSLARRGVVETVHGKVETPFFMTIATKGVVKTVDFVDLENVGIEIILGNTYHLYLQPGDEYVAQNGGLHKFMNVNKPMLTDSGGYQVFSLGARKELMAQKNNSVSASMVKISEEGVAFCSHLDGSKHFLTPEKSVDIQMNLGSDMMMVLDECPPWPATREYAHNSLLLTIRWAERCVRHKKYREERAEIITAQQGLFGIVQGSVYHDLRQESARQLVGLNLDGYALGGLAVGEPREQMYEVIDNAIGELPVDKPRYLMGVGYPEEIIAAVKRGIDMFDCVIPTREGRHGRLFVRRKDVFVSQVDFYETVNINNAAQKLNHTPINPNSKLPQLREYTWSYLYHLYKIQDPLGAHLATLNNIEFYRQLMLDLRQAIDDGEI